MKQLIFSIVSIILLCITFVAVKAQSTNKNYIVATVPTVEVIDPATLTEANSFSAIQYFDGLGRPIETVQKAQSSIDGTTWRDLVNLTEYDGMGREYRQWLFAPVSTSNGGAYVNPTNITGASPRSYFAYDMKPYSTTNYESSPLNRVTGKYGPGSSWYAGKKNDSILYLTNIGDVANFSVNSSNQLTRDANNYAANTLYKTQFMDEDGKLTFEYKDISGQVVMKQNSTDAVKTYYVYNDLGQLCYVLPPIASDSLPSSGDIKDNNGVLQRYAYIYKYDERGNNVVKRLPGCDSICMVYDKANRLIMSQDGNQRLKNKWTVTKYDVFGRVLYTGLLTATGAQNLKYFKDLLYNQVITETYDVTNTFYNTGYTCTGSLTGIIPLTVNYYDTYKFLKPLVADGIDTTILTYDISMEPVYGIRYKDAKGLLTGTRTYILDNTISKYLPQPFIMMIADRLYNHEVRINWVVMKLPVTNTTLQVRC